jgi:hypothetical protein
MMTCSHVLNRSAKQLSLRCRLDSVGPEDRLVGPDPRITFRLGRVRESSYAIAKGIEQCRG